MKKNVLLASLLFLFLTACQQRKIDQLLPDTVVFLEHQAEARCHCLELYGDEYIQRLDQGIAFMQAMPQQYNMNNLSPQDLTEIRAGIIGFQSYTLVLSSCIQQRVQPVYQPDELTQALIQYDLKEVLQLDTATTEHQRTVLTNLPSIELMEDYCPDQITALLKMQDFLKLAETLPQELQ